MKFYDGHLVYSTQGNMAAIGIMLTDEAVNKLPPLDPSEELLGITDVYIASKPFERRDSYLGTMLVCSADDASLPGILREMQDLEESLRLNHGLDLRRIDHEHIRPFQA